MPPRRRCIWMPMDPSQVSFGPPFPSTGSLLSGEKGTATEMETVGGIQRRNAHGHGHAERASDLATSFVPFSSSPLPPQQVPVSSVLLLLKSCWRTHCARKTEREASSSPTVLWELGAGGPMWKGWMEGRKEGRKEGKKNKLVLVRACTKRETHPPVRSTRWSQDTAACPLDGGQWTMEEHQTYGHSNAGGLVLLTGVPPPVHQERGTWCPIHIHIHVIHGET